MLTASKAWRSWLVPDRAITLLLLAGAGLRIGQYVANPALWLDELAAAHNVITRPLPGLLTEALSDGQIAPPGFLLVTRALVLVFGSSEYGLRLFSLLCSLAALPFLARVARRVLAPTGALVAVALFSLSAGVAVFAADAKQYPCDVLVILVLTDLALGWLEAPIRRRRMALAAGGALLVWFSQPAVFVLAGVGAALLLAGPPKERRALVPTLLLWAGMAALSVAYARARMSPGLASFMTWFWRDGFMPWPPHSVRDVLWPFTAVADVFDQVLDFPWPTLYLALALIGVASLLRRSRAEALVLLLPLGLTLAAAIAHAFPFRVRVVLFVVPTLLLLVAEGAWRLGTLLRPRLLERLVPLAVALPPLVMLTRNPPVWRLDDARPVFAELQRQRQPGDVVYVYYPSWQAVRFYGERYGMPLEAVDLGSCQPELRDYLRELDRYRGRERVWFVSTFELPRIVETAPMLAYLDAIGVRRATIEGPRTNRPGKNGQGMRWASRPGNYAHLYDLSDPVRLASASAELQHLPPSVSFVGVPRCKYGPIIPQVPTVGDARRPAE